MGKPNGPCWWCLKAVKWIPVVFILTVVFWSYYAYVVQLCYYAIESYVQKAFYLFFFHILFLLFLWSYWQTVFTDLGRVPDKFRIPPAEMEKLQQPVSEEAQRQILEQFAQDLPITNRTIKGAIRFCEKCQLIKPDRAHHCSVCGTCVLKMDHHCPWVNNCVGFHNYKFFMLFLAYALLYCMFIAGTSLEYFVKFWKGQLDGVGKFHLLFLFCVALMFAVSLTSLFFYHCYLILHNRSTLEAFRPPMFRTGKDKDGFSLGRYNNFQEVFGDNSRLWFLPVFTSLGDGNVYPVRSQHQVGSNTYNSMGSTQNRYNFDEMSLVEEATILALGTGYGIMALGS
ncbi:palmitoyltransferase ZDHHC15B-like isoform X6 [Neodiprion virginianus]|uniref:Palmitoyltransferase n=1 Tax=Neodiprion lecontei TaxID=441921 RepID=A0A6J0BIX3_NEOLC|nr:palmitoyltransferase ZDHHC15B isoform X6 [Neodiprion lecontei]XP_046422559.1 palmitoyltransferase ZDHHC15B-like isoform X6 [Neodiprion fabricii]XP_046615901.1 palmitoyltransferase ZDHHC15B-like isoform X6 [Neodiprion virginianus]